MKLRNALSTFIAALGVGLIVQNSARASEILLDESGFIQGTQSFEETFDLSTPGTMTVTLTNVPWPTQLASLSLLLSSTSGALAPLMTVGSTQTFQVPAGDVFAQWFGTAQGPLNAGVFGLNIQFTPSGSSGNPVPLPTSIVLLLSGMGLLIWQRRTRALEPNSRAEADWRSI